MLDTHFVMDRQTCFRFKASFAACTIMQILQVSLDHLSEQLSKTISRAPNLFLGSPLIIDLEPVKDFGVIDFAKLKTILLENSLVPLGVRGGSEQQHIAAATLGLPLVAIGSGKPVVQETAEPINQINTFLPSKIITQPIRSGMQVYAENSDLIITSSVSPGAELIADGNIHIYGPLRGRALAGVKGNINARIFCSSLEAELVSVAGFYLVKDDLLNLNMASCSVQIRLEGEHLKVEKL